MSGRAPRVAVIGGGLAGIAAGLALRANGIPYVVLEAEPTLGGKARTVSLDGALLERGPVSFNGRHDVIWRLLEALGLEGEAVEVGTAQSAPGRAHRPSARFLVRHGTLQGLSPHPLSLLTTGALSWPERWRLLTERWNPLPVGVDESVHTFFARRFGESFAAGPLAAFVTGVFAGDPQRLSVEACFPELVERTRQHGSFVKAMLAAPKPRRRGVFTLRGGMGQIAHRASALLDARTGAAVTALERIASGWRVTAGQYVVEVEQLVMATEAPVAAKLLWPSLPELGHELGQVEYAPLTLLHWREHFAGGSRLPAGFGYLAPPSAQKFALGTLFMSDLHGEASDQRRFSTFIGGALTPERAALSDAELLEGLNRDLAALTGGAAGDVLHVERWRHAVYQPNLGHHERREVLGRRVLKQPLLLAGSYLGAAAMKDAIDSGFAAGETAAARLASTQKPAGPRDTLTGFNPVVYDGGAKP